MAPLPQGPYILSMTITVSGLAHDLELNCDTLGTATPGMDPADLGMAARSESAEISLEEAANTFWAAYRPLVSSLALCSTYTLWQAGLNNTRRTFISGGVLATPNGLGNAAPVLAWQETLTFRSATGRIGRLIVLEGVTGGNDQIPLDPSGGGIQNALAAYVLSPESIMCGRDRAYFVQALNVSRGQNEAVFENRYRP